MKATNPIVVYEVDGRRAVGEGAAKSGFGLHSRGVRVLDARSKDPKAEPWHLSNHEYKTLARAHVDEDDPGWFAGTPPCTDQGVLNWNCIVARVPPPEVKKRLRIALRHSNCVCEVNDRQLQRGEYVLHETPTTARSWNQRCIQLSVRHSRVGQSRRHQYMYGLKTNTSANGRRAPAMKPTMCMQSQEHMLRRLGTRCKGLPVQRCKGLHFHLPLEGSRAQDAEDCRQPLTSTILQRMEEKETTSIASTKLSATNEIGFVAASLYEHRLRPDQTTPTPSQRQLAQASRRATAAISESHMTLYKVAATTLMSTHAKRLPPHRMRAASIDELNYVNDRVWELTSTAGVARAQDNKLVRTRWAHVAKDTVKNGVLKPDVLHASFARSKLMSATRRRLHWNLRVLC